MAADGISRLCHWGPSIALSIIFALLSSTLYSILIYWRSDDMEGPLNLTILLIDFLLIMYNFLTACLRGPGRVPPRWTPDNEGDTRYLQYCDVCEGYKAPRAHHCSKCQRCCLKMDHHCPWINNCVGHRNHAPFVRFLFHVTIGCSHAFYLQALSLYRTFFVRTHWMYRRLILYGPLAVTANLLCCGLTIGVTLAVGILLVTQLLNIRKNHTEIELWIMRKVKSVKNKNGNSNSFHFPYDLGWKKNCKSVLWTQEGDGIMWETRADCHQYTLTMKQIELKKDKREHTYLYEVVRNYHGSRDYFGICFGCRVACSCPNPDEPRLCVKQGDRVMVTRIYKHWLYGNRVLSHLVENGIGPTVRPRQYSKERGWFPRTCGAPINKRK